MSALFYSVKHRPNSLDPVKFNIWFSSLYSQPMYIVWGYSLKPNDIWLLAQIEPTKMIFFSTIKKGLFFLREQTAYPMDLDLGQTMKSTKVIFLSCPQLKKNVLQAVKIWVNVPADILKKTNNAF